MQVLNMKLNNVQVLGIAWDIQSEARKTHWPVVTSKFN